MKRFLFILVSLLCTCDLCAAKKVVWVIDAGHGGYDVGCEFGYAYEKHICLAVAKEVGRLVSKNMSDVRVVYTREKDAFLTLQQRCNVANARGAALFLSIHVNSAPNPFARGTESFFATNVPMKGTQAGKSELLALLLQKQYLKNGREVSRGVKQRELYVCENTNMPSVLTEVGFITHSGDRNYITSKAGQNELAQAIYEALSEWKQLTKGGKVPQRTLRDLRYTHHDPITMVTTPQRETTEADARAKEAAEAKVVAEAQAEEKAKAQAQAQKQAQQGATAEPATPVVTEPATPTAAEGKIYFAIQLMNTAKKLEAGDYRLKGFKDVRFIPAGERFKGIYSYSESYLDIKNELVQVRETFPEAFIVAFRGDLQITTAEALANLKL